MIKKLTGVLLLVQLALGTSSYAQTLTPNLEVNQINEDGFGDPSNRYAWSMATFKGKVYVGTLNAVRANPGLGMFFFGGPFATNGGQIWQGTKNGDSWSWRKVFHAQNKLKNHYGFRKLSVVGDYLYGVTANHLGGFLVLRTENGTDWEVVSEPGFGSPMHLSGRGIGALNGYLYVGVENRILGGQIWRRAIDEQGDFVDGGQWEQFAKNGIDKSTNIWFSDFAEANGYLYLGTLNSRWKMEVWRTNGKTLEQVWFKSPDAGWNMAAMKLTVYQDRLFVGTMNQLRGGQLYATQDDLSSYDSGEDFRFKSVIPDEIQDRNSPYVWYLAPYNDRLYMGSFTTATGFRLSSSLNGLEDWTMESSNGFDEPSNWGVRSMDQFEDSLIIGTSTASDKHSGRVYEAKSRN